MQNVVLWALLRAGNLSDNELAQEIKQYESGKDTLPKGLKVWAPVFLNVFRHVLEDRNNHPKVEMRRQKILDKVF